MTYLTGTNWATLINLISPRGIGDAVFCLVFQGHSFKDLLFGLLAKKENFTVSG